MNINFRILLLKVGLPIDGEHYFKDQRRSSVRLTSVMFRGTPCLLITWIVAKNIKSVHWGTQIGQELGTLVLWISRRLMLDLNPLLICIFI